uniref:Testis expressed 264, ER-phagy receptor n=1 Tax=Cyprinus carpio TaxID=7962 RepID=A0A8C2BZ24_CYPCA
MWEWQISSLIGFISLVLFLVAVCYILYSGLTTEVHIRTGLPPVRSITIAYKYKVGPYKKSGSLFRESCSIGPKLPCIGIFYDDPKKERKLCAHPFLEIYKGGMIHYMGPLARQGDFYVPEVREAQRWLLGKESEEDRRTDITGADSDSECSSVSRLPPSESRDTSPAPSTTRMHSHGDRDRSWDFDHVERSDTSSVSSFEELDLDSDRMDRCDHTPQPITVSGKNNLQGQDREMMVEEE